MTIDLEIRRFNPQTDTEPRFQRYTVTVEPTDRVLDALMDVKRNHDGSLAFRKSCAHGVCGSDAMVINGKEGLACKTLIQDVADGDGATVRLEPARHQPVQRDLMVSQDAFFTNYSVGAALALSRTLRSRVRRRNTSSRRRNGLRSMIRPSASCVAPVIRPARCWTRIPTSSGRRR